MENTCPNCGSRDTRRSRRVGLLATLLSRFLLDPYRCRSCRRRFFRREGDQPDPELARKAAATSS